MKIALVRMRYVPYGGAENYLTLFGRELIRQGHEVHIFANRWDVHETCGSSLDSDPFIFHKVPMIKGVSFFKVLSFAVFSNMLLKREKFDIIISFDRILYQDIYRAGDGCHREWLEQRWKRIGILRKISIIFNPYHWLILSLERILFKGHSFKRIIAISRLVKENIIRHYHVNEADIDVIYNGVDLKRFDPQNRNLYRMEIRKQYNISDDDFVILFVGSGFERKGVKYLLEAVKLVAKPLTVLIVGKGQKKKLEGLTKTHRVVFCGMQRDVHKYYAASDLFVFPTIYEPFGNVHLEALASGLPVISTSLSGASEIIKDGVEGFIFEDPASTDKIAAKIELLMDKDIREPFVKRAREKAEMFTLDESVRKTVEVLG